MISSSELRQKFLDFFKAQDHEIVQSASLVPANDKTLLFTNAGMVQFKDTFLGIEKRNYSRATSSQRCVRAGGKHNDLENVGYTARHHTFFEMLGNFSFGDYFKEEAIRYGWEFLTEVLKLPAEKLWVTIFEEDDEAADIWLNKVGVDPKRFSRIGAKDNFWQMGDTGPCGPCSEIFYDHGPEIAGGPPGTPEEDGDRYIEIWNLVFMQYNRFADGSLEPLPKPSVDTGMGLERLAAILQNVHSNYEIDLFQNLIKAAATATHCKDLENNSLRVIADHIRSCAFLVVDGVLPSNEGRGYVLRRIIRRAIRHGHKLGQKKIFFYTLVKSLIQEMGEAYPELKEQQLHVERVLEKEEKRFAETLEQGMVILESAIKDLKGKEIPGDVVFKLYDTYGFPVDLTADVAREHGLNLDMPGFEKEMEAQRDRGRSSNQFSVDMSNNIQLNEKTTFLGYENLRADSKVVALINDGELVDELSVGDEALIVLEETPFYAESGGQVGDRGELSNNNFQFEVTDTQKQGDAILHIGLVKKGVIKKSEKLTADVDESLRQATILNHSATHLLHATLRKVLGDHVQQKGSLVDQNRLRFDFSHFEAVKPEEISTIEQIVNQQIRLNNSAQAQEMSMDDAMSTGAMALFGEKYGDKVRVLSIGEFSVELCGGTHVQRAGDIGLFKITSETGIASGVRRIEAVTGNNAFQWLQNLENRLLNVASVIKASPENVDEKVVQLVERNRSLEKELQALKSKFASQVGTDVASQAVDINGINVLATHLEGADTKTLRDTLDQLKNKLGSAAIVLAAVEGEQVRLVAGVTKDKTNLIKAGELVNSVAMQVGGKGGGRPDMAQAGGNNPQALDAALASVPDWVREHLANA